MNNKPVVLKVALISAMGGFLFGFDTGVIGGTQLYFTDYFSLTPTQQGWAVGSALYGCFGGALVAGYLTDALSRKYTLLLSAVLFCLSAWGSGAATSLSELVFYRVIGGVGIGFASMAAPMYISEISPPDQRGRMVSLYQLSVVLGFFIVFLTTYMIGGGTTGGLDAQALEAIHQHNLQTGWRWMFWSELLPACVFFTALFFVPHSPRWLVIKGREAEAKQVLDKLGLSYDGAASLLAEIKKSVQESASGNTLKLFSKGALWIVFIGVMLSVFQQITGINAILYYGAEIFSNALGYGPQDALKQQLWLGAVNLVCTFIALYAIDLWGRKPLYLVGTAGMFVGLSGLGLTIYFQQLGIVSLVSILLFIGAFAMSMGPVVWVVLSEIFPNRLRAAAMAIAVGAQWLFNGLVASVFPVINKSQFNETVFHGALPYFIFAAFCVVAFVFFLRWVPETKGHSLEEIEQRWRS